jgi:hypothetical protein
MIAFRPSRNEPHERYEVVRPDLRLDESRERLLDRKRAANPRVIVVEEDREQPDVVTPRLRFLVIDRANLTRGRFARLGIAGHLDQPELFDRLRLAVLHHFEIVPGEIGNRHALPVRDDDVHPHEIDARAERWLLRRGRGFLRRRLLRWRLLRFRGLLGAPHLAERCNQHEDGGNARDPHRWLQLCG